MLLLKLWFIVLVPIFCQHTMKKSNSRRNWHDIAVKIGAQHRRLTVWKESPGPRMALGSFTQCPGAGHDLHNRAWQPWTSQSRRGARLSLELGTYTSLEHSLPLLQPFAGLRHIYFLGVSLAITSLNCSLGSMPVLGVPTWPLVTELQLPILWNFPVSWELLEATDGVFLLPQCYP